MVDALTVATKFILTAFPEVIALWRFGSYGSEYETKDSDLDVAILASVPLDPIELWFLAQKISCQIHREVDLVDLWHSSTVFRFEVLTSGERIFCRDEKRADSFDNDAISAYLDLNQQRKEILEEYGFG